MTDVREAHCLRIQQLMNDYLRRILDYQTLHDCFVKVFQQERVLHDP